MAEQPFTCRVAYWVAAVVAVPLMLAGCSELGATSPLLTNWSQEIADGAIPASTAFGGGLYLPDHLACIVGQVEGRQARWTDAYEAIVPVARARRSYIATPVALYNVPGVYVDPSGFEAAVKGVTADADAAYALAVVYSISGDTTYAAVAAAILRAWASTNAGVTGHDGSLSMTEVGVGFILSAELLRGYAGWARADSTVFRQWIQAVYLPLAAAPIRDEPNNWGEWGSFGAIAADYYLGNLSGLDSETVRLQGHIDSQIADDGSLPAETARGPGSAIWYTYFALDPMTAGAEVIKNAGGPDLFTWRSPHGHTIGSALDHLLVMLNNEASQGLVGPGPGDPWPADLFEAMGDEYDNPSYISYAAPRRPISYLGHHYAWTFPTLEGAPASICPETDRAPLAHTKPPVAKR
jgi:hypothetical protein